MIYGDTVQKLNVTVDAEGGEYFTAIPQLLAIRQAGNLYGYAVNNPISFVDYSGEQAVAVHFDQNPDFTLRMGSFLLGAAISAMLIDKLTDDDPPILYAKKSSKGTSHPNSAVAMGGSSPASPDPDDDPDRKMNVSKSESTIWKQFNNVKNSTLKSSGKGAKTQYYEWDHTHNDIEVYNAHGKHLGSMDPVTGEMYKPPVPGRTITIP